MFKADVADVRVPRTFSQILLYQTGIGFLCADLQIHIRHPGSDDNDL